VKAAQEALVRLAARAADAGFAVDALEARLHDALLETSGGRSARLAAVADEAKRAGFGLIARKAAGAR
jgi:hypothetical protein